MSRIIRIAITKNISDLINAISVLNIQPVDKENFDLIQESDLQLINAYQLDVCIKLGFQNCLTSLKWSSCDIVSYGLKGMDIILPPGRKQNIKVCVCRLEYLII